MVGAVCAGLFGAGIGPGEAVGVLFVERCCHRRGAGKYARADVAAKIDDAVRQQWQPQVRKRRQQHATTGGGITVETRARFGYTAPIGTTDDGRFRRLTVHLPSSRPTHNACSFVVTEVGGPLLYRES